ncbi:hypothetical protein CANARDRAFT_197159 [[Candida] arabinofermentans NRRL YB-2248]|uniref:Major facilitator superfamily (MFS) profile domain-containing protein n=1 Tax=[Candida] arabinofermentans NRRL YB-2248 TaxID=983967 RepID=A0A1E4T3H3_9ASCO|nr:hypothetical protein CANARDRAFT_197159 [[Candida] arabinofermentans NRRL YB-2248]
MGYFSKDKKVDSDETKSVDVGIETIPKSASFSSLNDQSSSETLDSNNPFSNPVVEKHYAELYESTKYECRHHFDAKFTWTPEEEKNVVWKLEWRVTLLACFLFVALQVDRGNLAQAVADNMLEDLGMTTTQYNWGNTIFYLTFLCAELPSQLVSKRLGSDVWIPIQMILWSIVTICQCKMKNRAGFYATRALIGLLEGGFIPDLVLWMSYFYTSSELSIRLSFFWTSLSVTQIVTSILAYGILHMRGVSGFAGWAWIFIIEGLFTLLIGIAAAFLMVPSAVQTKKPWNKKGWFTEREEKIVVNRVLRDDPTKGDMHNRQGINFKMLWYAISDYYLWPVYLIGLIAYIPTGVLTAYLTLVLKSLGFTTFEVNLLAIPYMALHIVLLLGITWYSEKIKDVFLVALFQPLYTVPLLGVLRFWGGAFVQKWGSYALVILILGNPYIHAMMVSICSRNAQSIKTRTVSASIYNMFVQAGSIIASNVYQASDKPLYKKGNGCLFGLALAMFPLLIGSKYFYVFINNRRAKIWDAMTAEEQNDYILNTKDTGSRRINFRFSH